MQNSFKLIFEKLTEPGSRLPWIKEWLLEEVWSSASYQKDSPLEFLHRGEEKVNHLELLISSAATRIYDELTSYPHDTKVLQKELSSPETAVVVFDGMSLREIPMIIKLAEKSGFTMVERDAACAAVPSETIDYIERELPCGRVAPSQLQGRKELKERGIAALYSGNYAQPLSGDYKGMALLLWSSFPDSTYSDSGARFERHFENMHALFETAWINTVQQIKGTRKIIITSDHGYIFFGAGMDFPRNQAELRELNSYFGNDRSVSIAEKGDPPVSGDIYIDAAGNVAMIKGRIKTRSTGEAAAKLYKHGGLSLMEMLTPWVVLEKR